VDEYVDTKSSTPPTVLFYVGNESPLEEYVNNTGLMYTLAPELNSLLVFVEHRYMGQSTPNTKSVRDCMGYDTMAQAIADYAAVASFIKSGGANTIPVSFDYDVSPYEDAAIVTFGGSYGGMLSAYIRYAYPSLITGAIAASAPVWGLPLTDPQIDAGSSFVGHGMAGSCGTNFKAGLVLINEIAKLPKGLEYLSEKLGLCVTATSTEEILDWLKTPWFDLAEGNFPFPSTYITFAVGPGAYPLPAWPMKVACEDLGEDLGVVWTGDESAVDFTVSVGGVSVAVDWDVTSSPAPFTIDDVDASPVPVLLAAMVDGVNVWCNVTGLEQCNDPVSCASGRRRMQSLEEAVAAPAAGRDEEFTSGVCTVDISEDPEFNCWEPMNCNDSLNLPNTLAQGLGNDIYWPPTAARGVTLETFLGPRGTMGKGCELGEGLFGYPPTMDAWSTRMQTEFGGLELDGYSNVVFSNGYLDPWASGGVMSRDWKPGDESVIELNEDGNSVAVVIEEGAHHLDLMIPDENDPQSVLDAREVERDMIKRWVREWEGQKEEREKKKNKKKSKVEL
jgi:lysosomal Pro-X carboxypeptidase